MHQMLTVSLFIVNKFKKKKERSLASVKVSCEEEFV